MRTVAGTAVERGGDGGDDAKNNQSGQTPSLAFGPIKMEINNETNLREHLTC